MTRRAWMLFAVMCLIWGVPYLLIRVAVRDVAPGTLVFLRTAVGGLVLLPIALANGGFGPVLARWRPLLAFAVIEMAVPWLLLSDAERHLSSSLSGLLIAAVPMVGVLIARRTGSAEHVDRWQLLGLAGGMAGVAMLVGLDFGSVNVGALVEILVVVVCYAVGPVILARRLADLPSIPVACAALLVVGSGYLPYAALRPPSRVPASGWWAIAVLALVCTALAFVLFFALIAAIGPARATVITYVNPAVAVLGGVLVLGEDLTLGIVLGFPLILAGSVLAARRRAVAAVPEAAACEQLEPDQSILTGPFAVSKTAATSPVPSSEDTHSTATSSSGRSADVPR
ncbi:MAG: DMT family transporter [Jatrophihabitantaceae bacterium]